MSHYLLKAGLHKSRGPRLPSNYTLCDGPWYLLFFSMELASCH